MTGAADSPPKIRRALVADGDAIGLLPVTDAARMFEVLSGEEAGYIGGAPGRRFTRPAEATGSKTTSR